MKQHPVVVITGGSRGIGYETARALAADGWRIALCARNYEAASNVAEEIAERYSVEAFGVAADVTSPHSLQTFADQVKGRFGAVDLLICNAAVLGPIGALKDVQCEDLENAFATNVLGVLYSIRSFWDHLTSAEGFQIIVLSGGGLGGPNPLERALAYVPSKAAITSIVELLADEVQLAGGSINAIAPGRVPTTFMDSVLQTDRSNRGDRLVSQVKETMSSSISGAIQEFLDLVRFLVAPTSSRINGRLLSAKRDDIENLSSLAEQDISPNLFRLRRIDGSLFSEAAE